MVEMAHHVGGVGAQVDLDFLRLQDEQHVIGTEPTGQADVDEWAGIQKGSEDRGYKAISMRVKGCAESRSFTLPHATASSQNGWTMDQNVPTGAAIDCRSG